MSRKPQRIQYLTHIASVMVEAFSDARISVQRWRDLENSLSTETLVAGIARKSRAIRAMTGNSLSCA